eukprot:6190006-Pleurochrysis_carterae.AAC.5
MLVFYKPCSALRRGANQPHVEAAQQRAAMLVCDALRAALRGRAHAAPQFTNAKGDNAILQPGKQDTTRSDIASRRREVKT